MYHIRYDEMHIYRIDYKMGRKIITTQEVIAHDISEVYCIASDTMDVVLCDRFDVWMLEDNGLYYNLDRNLKL